MKPLPDMVADGAPVLEAAPPRAASAGKGQADHWVRRLWPFLAAHKRMAAVALVATLIGQAASVSIPLVQKVIVDDVVLSGDPSLGFWIAALLGAAGLAAIATIVRRANGNSFGFAVQHELRDAVYRHVQRLDVGYGGAGQDGEDRHLSTGEVISRSTADITLVQTLLSQLHVLSGSLFMVLASLAVMAVLSPLLALVALACLPLLVIAALRLRANIYPAVWADQRAQAELAGIIEENTTGVRVVRAFGQEERELNRYVAAAERLFGSRLRTARINARYAPVMQMVPTLGQLGVLLVGGWMAWNGAITVGTFVAFFSYLVQLAAPVRTLTNALSTVQQARAGANRILELLDSEPTVTEAPGARPLAVSAGAIAMTGVSFGHKSDKPLLSGLDLSIAPGETVAVVGGSGSGKSTLALMLARFHDPDAGSVAIDGQDIRDVTLASLRKAVGMVFEDALLFSGTVAENIAKGRPEATREEIRRAATIAGADLFISALPEGYDTPVAELGASLSGGQRQRLTIARALLIDPPILVLDDATSAVDGRTEAGILSALRAAVSGRTTLLIARRQSTLAIADRVVMLADGRVAAAGSHAELLAGNPDYRRLVDTELAADLPLAEEDAIPEGVEGFTPSAWPAVDPDRQVVRTLTFTENVQAGGHSRRALPSGAELAAERGDISARLARLPSGHARPQVDVAAEISARPPFTLVRFAAPFRNGLLVGLALVLAETLLGIAVPLLIGRGVDGVVARDAGELLSSAAGLAVVLGLSLVVGGALLRHTSRTAERMLFALRVRIVAQLHRLPVERYEQEAAGRIMARATTDVDALATLLQQGLLNAVVGLTTCAGILIGLVILEPRLAVALLPVVPVLVIGTEWYRRASAKAYERSRQHVANVYAGIQEGVAASRVTRALASESRMASAFRANSESYRQSRERAARISAIYFPTLQFLSTASKALVLAFGAGLVASGEVAVGILISFLLYLDQFFAPIQQLSQVFDQWLQAGTSLRRIKGLLSEPVPDRGSARPDAPATITGGLRFEDVTFRYPGSVKPALADFDLAVAPGTTLAVVGRTGAGKSTLARLVTRLSRPSEGRILIDGTPLGDFSSAVLRRNIAYVPQEPMLFAATVADNIAYARPDATPAEIEAAARQAGAHGFIAALPQGYRTLIAERGRSLSAGQRQLLCLARALLLDPRILVLDEATAQLDLATESVIERALATGRARTTVIIAHRLQTVRRADRVIVLEGGRLVEDGTPGELLARGGWFSALHAPLGSPVKPDPSFRPDPRSVAQGAIPAHS